MKLTYDPKYNVAYIRLRETTAPVETLHLSEELNVDIGPDGTVYGIELLNANEQLKTDAKSSLVVVNEASGESVTIPLDI
jgi:uncharacterized protein YuzE